ncbi:MAG TPA: hypothetical protein DCE41_19400 [Cytophagales bacterium]|nr:hypothetical protein [Cytophagales bacterium]
MKKIPLIILWLGILMGALILESATQAGAAAPKVELTATSAMADTLKTAALEVLKAKCNVCHRKQNPFMVFTERNMAGKARKIYRAVFVQRIMPKGNEIRLASAERATLEKWLSTQINR